MFWNHDSTAFPKTFVAFVKIFSVKIVSLINGSVLVVYPVHAVLLIFNDAYKRCWIQSRHTSVAFLPVACAAKQQQGNNESTELKESLYE